MMKAQAATSAPIANDAIDETPLLKFENELQRRYPNRMIQRFEMPSKVAQARAVYLVEVTSRDEIEAAKYADATMSDIERKSNRLTNEAQHRECVRLSIVGLVARDPISYRHVNNGSPFHEIDTWPSKATTCLQTFFNGLNSVPTDELLEGLRGARTIGASVPPTNETEPSASITK